MDELHDRAHDVPSDVRQLPVIWRYELLRYLRSRRLLASVAIVVIILGLINFLPPALGHPYSGTSTGKVVEVMPPENITGVPGLAAVPIEAVGVLYESKIDLDTLTLYVNGTVYPNDGTSWSAIRVTFQGSSAYALLFVENVTGSVVTADYDWYTAPDSFAAIFLSFAPYLIIICATFFGADALVGEFQNRTGYLIFPNPVKRGVLFFGKYAASLTAGFLVLAIFYIGVTVSSPYNAGGWDDDLGASFLFASEYMVAAMAIAYVISALLKGTTGATVLTFFLFLLILPIVDSVGTVVSMEFEWSLTHSSNVISNILYDPYPSDWSQEIMPGFTYSVYYPTPSTAALVMGLYAVAALFVGLVLFKRKQLVG